MEQKVYDKNLNKWVVVSADNAKSIELTNPGFVNEAGGSVSVNNGFTKLDNRMTKAEQNIIWLSHNKGEGGSGGGGGTADNYSLEVLDGDIIYTSTSSATVNIIINSNGIKKSFTVVAKNLETNKIIGTWKKYSMSKTDITINDLSDTTNIELSAYDATNLYVPPVYFKVVSGAITLEIQKTPPKTMYIGSVNEVPLNYTVTNNIQSNISVFKLFINNIEVENISDIDTPIRYLSFDARKLLFESGNFNPKSGQKFIFKAQASTTLNGNVLYSDNVEFDITVADANNLIIVTDEITEFTPSDNTGETINDLTKYKQGLQLGFNYYFSCGLTYYYSFNMEYSIDLMEMTESGPSLVKNIDTGEIKNITKGEDNRFSYSTVNMEVTESNQYIQLTLFGYAVNDPGDTDAQYTKIVNCVLIESDSVEMHANNDTQTLLAYYSRVSGFPNTTTGTWNYPIKTSGIFEYNGSFINKFPNGVNLNLEKVNGVTSGFINNIDGINKTPAIRLEGESFGYLEVGNKLFPNLDISSGSSIFQASGFCISTTFKADETSDENETILSLGRYNDDNTLNSGYEITTTQVLCKIGSADTLSIKLPQNELLTVDLDVSLLTGTGWYFKIYLNGVLSAVTRVDEADIDWTFDSDIYLGCRHNNGINERFSNVNFYDIKIYTSSQSEYAIVQNYISSVEHASLKNGFINPDLDSELRIKNLFDSEGNCLIWDKLSNNGKGSFMEGDVLYNKLLEQMEINTPYPLVLVEETSSSSTLFEPFSTAIFSASDKYDIMDKTFPCKITYTDSKGKCIINTPAGVASEFGVRIGLQGTSSLSYNSKNYELYMGYKDEENRPLLFQPTDDWLPENQFTLKADVMDSAHVNNVVIGQIVNGKVVNESGEKITPFGATPPMALGNDVWNGDSEKANKIRSKFKHTSEGFPCLLFIRFAPDKDGNTQQPKFMGIYNFNLGRHAYHNLGLRLLTDYNKEVQDGPSIVTDYSVNNNYWDKSTGEGTYSVEINQNSSSQGAFQQDALPIVKFMGDVVYTSKDTTTAYNQVQKLYTQLANMALSKTQKYTMDDAGQSPTKEIPGEFYNLDKNAYYNFAASDKHLNWNNSIAYYLIALIFGMVDSMCKNLTMRSWGTDEWYTCFYDMDTAFGENNAGQDIVEYWAHLHRWYNIQSQDTNITTYTSEKNYVSNDEIKQYYSSWWNRIWEVLENLAGMDSGDVGDRPTIETVYTNLRTNLFPSPEEFIDNYYKSYTDKTGSIMFNYDYQVKYLKLSKKYDIDTGKYEDYTDFSQLKFLHGNRVMHVRDWFRKRVLFLDGVYGIEKDNILIPISVDSPINTMWSSNKVTGSKVETQFGTNIRATSKMLYRYTLDKSSGSFWIDEKDRDAIVLVPGGETILYMYANKYITDFSKFKNYNWTNLDNIDLPSIETMDLSNLTNIDSGYFFVGGVYNPTANNGKGRGLKNVKNLILSNVKLIGSDASAYTLDTSNCLKLQNLDVSNSSITKIRLPEGAVLKRYNLSGTDITDLNISNQAFLEDLLIDGCNYLSKLEISNCSSLESINIPNNVREVIIRNCKSLSDFNLTYNSSNSSISPLVKIVIDNCESLKLFNISGQNNPNLEIDLVGAWNLEELKLDGSKFNRLTLPPLEVNGEPYFNSLKSLDISRTEISSFNYNGEEADYLDLANFKDLDNIQASYCQNLKIIKCPNNINNPITLKGSSFSSCNNLERIYGYYELDGIEIFKDCNNLILNEQNTYTQNGVNNFIDGDNVTNIVFSDNVDSCLRLFENCSKLSYDDFRFVMFRTKSNITDIERMFSGCTGVSGNIWYDILRNMPNLNTMKESFNQTKLNGIFYSRRNDYSYDDDSTWGILDFTPNLKDAEAAFSNTTIEWIDNNIFQPRDVNGTLTYSSLVNITGMFKGCSILRACKYTHDIVMEEAMLQSENFFVNLDNLVDMYPKNVFSGCRNIKMEVNEDADGNTLLFHRKSKPASNIVLDNSLYSGINLVGEIKPNVFGGISDTVGEYFIPTFSSINYPFGDSQSELDIDISTMDDMFKSFNNVLLQAVGVFYGLNLIGTKRLPINIFKGCIKLNSVQDIFSNIKLDYNGEEFEFPSNGMFDDCVSLQNISGILSNTNNYKIKLVGEGFKNCRLSNVSYAFKDSSVYGMIPYRLLFMANNNTLNKTITNMGGIFSGCYYLGYDSYRLMNIGEDLGDGTYTSWSDKVVLNRGNKLLFNLDKTNMSKTYNYDLGTDNAIYSTDENCFDTWYLDGTNWDNATASDSSEQPDLDLIKSSLYDAYLKYDNKQSEVISSNNEFGFYTDTHQNYAIPTDLFRYCSPSCTIGNILSDLFWYENEILEDLETGIKSVIQTKNINGVSGRIPCRLLEGFRGEDLSYVFSNTHFDNFVGLNANLGVRERGIAYPIDLLKYNSNCLSVKNLFSNTEISVGVDINSDLFENLLLLKNISGLWSDCSFDSKEYNGIGSNEIYPQIDFTEIFKNNTKITDASNLFAITDSFNGKNGLLIIDKTLLKLSYIIGDISGMFLGCGYLSGEVPEFQSTTYSYLNKYFNYLTGVSKSNITNADNLEDRLKPQEWL